LSQVTDAELQFGLWTDVEGDAQGPILIDRISWLASIDGSNSYSGLGTAGQTGDWIPEYLDLSSVPYLGDITGEPEVYLGWVFESDGSNPINYEGAFVDDAALWVYIDSPPTPPPTPPTLPITRHTTLTDFAGGRSHDSTVVEAEQGDGALILAAQVNTLGDWERLPSLPSALFDFATVTAKGHLFVIGGNIPGGQYQRRAYSAVIQDDGLLGHWVEVTKLPQALTAHTTVVANDHLFVLGGFNANGFQATVFSARIYDDGTLGEWNTALPALLEPLAVNASVSVHGYLYVLGGRKSNGPVIVSDKIYRAKVNADGTLGDWETLATELPHSSMWHEAVATCDHLYVIAGQDQVINEYSTVYQAEIHPDGSLGAWNETTALPKTLAAHAAVAIHGGILVTGGWSSPDPLFNPQRSVYWASVGPDCILGSWVELTPLPYRTYKHALAATDRYIYNLGGASTASWTLASVLMAPLQLGDRSVQQGVFNHQFYLGNNYTIECLHWTEEGDDDTEISLRYRVGASTGEYGPWSDYTSTNPITINALGKYLEYQLKFEGRNSLSDKHVTELSLSITPPDSVYLPLVVKE
jgi:N-acetylneuraminic acid mutarotase